MSASLLMSKIVNLNDARKKKRSLSELCNTGSDPREKRSEIRKPSSERLFVQIVSCPDDPELVGTTVSCATLDVSVSGLKVKSYEFIPVGCQLDLWIDISTRHGKFFLTCDVRWTQQVDEEGDLYHFGVALHDAGATDIDDWRSYQA